jgi:hypothetical protein
MRIWKLSPINPADPIWKLWSPDPIFVRAQSDTEARRLANLKTTQMFPSRPGEPIQINPWSGHRNIGHPSPTTCEDATEQTDEYSIDGPAAVLHHDENW